MDEYLEKVPRSYHMHRIDYTERLLVKGRIRLTSKGLTLTGRTARQRRMPAV